MAGPAPRACATGGWNPSDALDRWPRSGVSGTRPPGRSPPRKPSDSPDPACHGRNDIGYEPVLVRTEAEVRQQYLAGARDVYVTDDMQVLVATRASFETPGDQLILTGNKEMSPIGRAGVAVGLAETCLSENMFPMFPRENESGDCRIDDLMDVIRAENPYITGLHATIVRSTLKTWTTHSGKKSDIRIRIWKPLF